VSGRVECRVFPVQSALHGWMLDRQLSGGHVISGRAV
jgi:hypothetical protein